MSGICGILRFDGKATAERDVMRMVNAIAHRGPDHRKTVSDGPYAAGHLLMRTMREDLFDAQPLRDQRHGLLLVADARLDNREELASRLGIAADRLAELADSALILEAYRRWGENCADELLGDFVFAMWDGRARKLVLGRDHMGQRYVYCHHGADFFAFSSDVKGLWVLADVPRAFPDNRIGHLLLFDRAPKGAKSLYEGIKGVAAGSVLCIGADGGVTERQYWKPHADPAHVGRDEAYYVKTYRTVVEEAVACRLRRTLQPVALFFGGGFDSGAIAGLARPVVEAQGRKLICVSSVAPQDHRGPLRGAKAWVEVCRKHMPHIDVRYLTRDGKSSVTDLERMFATGDAPPSPNRFANDELFANAAAAGARVVMDGYGGDYTVNNRAQEFLAYLLRTGQWRRFFSEWRPHLRLSGQTVSQTLKHIVFSLAPMRVRFAWEWMMRGFRPFYDTLPISESLARELLADGATPLYALRLQLFGRMREKLVNVLEFVQNRATSGGDIAATHGLEFTQPYHDKRVVEFALAVPEELYVKNGRNRYLASQALRDVYPPEFQTRDRRNDDRIPDFLAMMERIRPSVLEQAARLEGTPELTRLVDFAKVRRLLDEASKERRPAKAADKAMLGLYGFLVARYVAWFRGYNI